jgi:hypothetical protein
LLRLKTEHSKNHEISNKKILQEDATQNKDGDDDVPEVEPSEREIEVAVND